ncbi:hypothetical protein INT43_003007 [Umbelopsis isabellina]|uniref:Eisosome component PIL1-domain-containing protein n=1 Tax=Mortierella isabellina TaxID=91625 RepID=A0A8H7PPW6_MORIS|nr:hypothetical protein INT43_003007 [Umbelopsis isabellina]
MSSINPFHQIRTHLAKGTGNLLQEDKHFYVFLQEEKNVLELFKQLAQERRQAAHGMVTYGRPLGDDLTDITEKVGQLMVYWSDVIAGFANNYEQYRNSLKTIAEQEKVLMSNREKKRSLEDRIHSTQRNQPEAVHRVNEYKAQLTELEQKMLPGETEIGNYKRMATKEALYILFNGMHELAGKTDIIATTAKYCADNIDVHPIQPGEQRAAYRSTEQTTRMVNDAKRALDTWSPDQNKVRRTLTSAHRGRNPLTQRRRSSNADLDKELPEVPPENTNMLSPPNPSPSLSTPISERDRNQYRRASAGGNVQQPAHYSGRESHRLSAPSTGMQGAPYKPNEYNSSSPWDDHTPSPPGRVESPTYPPTSYQLTPPDFQQYYQFYEQYTPPQPWDEVAGQLGKSPAIFHPVIQDTRRDAGGFVLPGSVRMDQELRSPTPQSTNSSERRSVPPTPQQQPTSQQQQQQSQTPPVKEESKLQQTTTHHTEKPTVKQQSSEHMPGDFPDSQPQPKQSTGKAEQNMNDSAKLTNNSNTTNNSSGGGKKVSALLAKFQNLNNK